MNIQSQPQVQFGYLTQAQRDKISEAKQQSSGQSQADDRTANLISDVFNKFEKTGEPSTGKDTTNLSQRPKMDADFAEALIQAIEERVSNPFLGPLDYETAVQYRKELDQVTKRLDKAEYLVPDDLVDTISEGYGVAYLTSNGW